MKFLIIIPTLNENKNITTIYKKIVNYIKKKNLDQNKDVFIIQLGSSSGRDLEYLYNIYPKLNYISTDINDEILDFKSKCDSLNDYTAKILSKCSSINSGYKLEKLQQDSLVNDLFACKDPNISPFNELIFKVISIETIKKMFR